MRSGKGGKGGAGGKGSGSGSGTEITAAEAKKLAELVSSRVGNPKTDIGCERKVGGFELIRLPPNFYSEIPGCKMKGFGPISGGCFVPDEVVKLWRDIAKVDEGLVRGAGSEKGKGGAAEKGKGKGKGQGGGAGKGRGAGGGKGAGKGKGSGMLARAAREAKAFKPSESQVGKKIKEIEELHVVASASFDASLNKNGEAKNEYIITCKDEGQALAINSLFEGPGVELKGNVFTVKGGRVHEFEDKVIEACGKSSSFRPG